MTSRKNRSAQQPHNTVTSQPETQPEGQQDAQAVLDIPAQVAAVDNAFRNGLISAEEHVKQRADILFNEQPETQPETLTAQAETQPESDTAAVVAEALADGETAAAQAEAQAEAERSALAAVVAAIRSYVVPTVRSFMRRLRSAQTDTGRAAVVAETAAGLLAPMLASYAVEFPDTARIQLTLNVKLDSAPLDPKQRKQYVHREVMRALTGNGSSLNSFIYMGAAITEVTRQQDADGIAQPHDRAILRAGVGVRDAVKHVNKYLRSLPAVTERSRKAQAEAEQRKQDAEKALRDSIRAEFEAQAQQDIDSAVAAALAANGVLVTQPQQDAQPTA